MFTPNKECTLTCQQPHILRKKDVKRCNMFLLQEATAALPGQKELHSFSAGPLKEAAQPQFL